MIQIMPRDDGTRWEGRIAFACSPLYDLVLGLWMIANDVSPGNAFGVARLATLRAQLTSWQQETIGILFREQLPIGTIAFHVMSDVPPGDEARIFPAAIGAMSDVAFIRYALIAAGGVIREAPQSEGVFHALLHDPHWAEDYLRRYLRHPIPPPELPDSTSLLAAITPGGPHFAKRRLVTFFTDVMEKVFPAVAADLEKVEREADSRVQAIYTNDTSQFVSTYIPRSVGDAPYLRCVPSAYLGEGFAVVPFDLSFDVTGEQRSYLVAYGSDIVPKIVTDGTPGAVMPEAAPTETYQEVYRLLADPARWALLRLLVARPCYGQELSELLGLSIATVSHHLNGLKKLDLVRIEREEHRLYYHLRTDRLRALLAGAEQQLLR